jgi:hypothetical protein
MSFQKRHLKLDKAALKYLTGLAPHVTYDHRAVTVSGEEL